MKKEIIYLSNNFDFKLDEIRWIMMNNYQILIKNAFINYSYQDIINSLKAKEKEMFKFEDKKIIYNNFLTGETTFLSFYEKSIVIESNIDSPYLLYILYRLGNYYLV